MSGKKHYPAAASDYRILEEIGRGKSEIVYRAHCIPLDEIVAMDLERCKRGTLAFLIAGRFLWFVLPYMAGGSCLNIMRIAQPGGFDEVTIVTVLREFLKALEYLHSHGYIHRDVKAGNILVDEHGGVRVADFVVASLFDCHNDLQDLRRRTRVGTPCWMAPEVLDSVCGYDGKADIWSLGMELAQGHPPFCNYTPVKQLQAQLLGGPPMLDSQNSKRFSKSFKNFVDCCLHKEQSKRLPAAKLLKHPVMKHAKSPEYLAEHILTGLPPRL